MVTSKPRELSSWAATSPASPAPRMSTFFRGAEVCRASVPSDGRESAANPRALRFRNSRRLWSKFFSQTITMVDHTRILDALLARFTPRRVCWLQYGTQEKQEEAKPQSNSRDAG